MKRETTMFRAFVVPEKARVMMERTTKFVPPAKSWGDVSECMHVVGEHE